MRTEVGVERKRKDSRYIHLRKNPQEQVTDRMWAEPVVELPWEENWKVSGGGKYREAVLQHRNWRVQ